MGGSVSASNEDAVDVCASSIVNAGGRITALTPDSLWWVLVVSLVNRLILISL
jgi:hypothetical protein